jgi:hypothetical protein
MSSRTSERIWTSLTASEAAAFAKMADSRGLRPSELAREVLLAFLGQPPQSSGDAATGVPALARLDTLVATLGRHVEELGRLVPATDDALAERDDVRATLQDIAHAVGVMAGSVVADDGGVGAFGPDR